MSLRGEVALVTGSTRGLGLAVARALHREGARMVVNYVNSYSAAPSNVAVELRAIAVQADVTKESDVRRLFEAAKMKYGAPVTIVVNNALSFSFNGSSRKSIDQITWADFDSQLKTTVQGALNTTQAAIPGFKEAGRGRIINIGTNLVQNPVVPYHDYTSAKGALLALTHTTAAELGPLNVTCNLVSGGLLRTTDASSATPKEVFEQIAAVTPLRKVTTPEELAGAVVFFAGPLASAVTGQQLVVDGGLVMT